MQKQSCKLPCKNCLINPICQYRKFWDLVGICKIIHDHLYVSEGYRHKNFYDRLMELSAIHNDWTIVYDAYDDFIITYKNGDIDYL